MLLNINFAFGSDYMLKGGGFSVEDSISPCIIFVLQQPKLSPGRLVVEVSRNTHTHTHTHTHIYIYIYVYIYIYIYIYIYTHRPSRIPLNESLGVAEAVTSTTHNT